MRASSVASLVALFSLVACSLSQDDASSADDSLRIDPTGTETMSTLIVQLPTATCLPGGSCTHPLVVNPGILLDGAAMNVGAPMRVLPGAHDLTISGTIARVNLVAGATRTMIVPVVKKVCENATGTTLAETHFGRVPSLRNAACPTVQMVDGRTLSRPPQLAGDTAVVPGLYSFPLETPTGTIQETRPVAEGELKALAFTLPLIGTTPDRFAVNLKFLDPRELPDAAPGSISSNCERNYSLQHSATGTLALKAFKFSECNYNFAVGGRSVALNQNSTNAITLGRLDVNDVIVTREDGSTYTTQGTYEVYFGGNLVAGPYSTNSGLDVLGGAYELVVKYNTAEGAKTNRYNVSF